MAQNNNQYKQMAPIKNTELEKVMADLKENQTPENQQALIRTLKDAKLLCPCDFDVDISKEKPGTVQNVHPSQIKFYLLNTKDGKTFFPAFTNTENMKNMKFGEGIKPKLIVRTMIDFDKLVQDKQNKATGIIINPGLNNIVIPENLVGAIAGRKIPAKTSNTIQASPLNIRYTEPPIYPTKMVNAVYDKCKTVNEISRVWLKAKLAGQAMSFLLVVESDKKDEHILNEIREAAVPEANDIQIETVFSDEKIMKDIIHESVALYDRNLEF
jgi:hypothetical protein